MHTKKKSNSKVNIPCLLLPFEQLALDMFRVAIVGEKSHAKKGGGQVATEGNFRSFLVAIFWMLSTLPARIQWGFLVSYVGERPSLCKAPTKEGYLALS